MSPILKLSDAVTLSIVTHGHSALLRRFLSQLNRCPPLVGTSVIVTLNLPGEHFDASEYDQLEVHVIANEKPRGFGANHNSAFRHCRTPWFCVLNPDLQVNGLEPLSALLEGVSNSEYAHQVGVIAPSVRASDGSEVDSVRENLTVCSVIGRLLFGRRFRRMSHQSTGPDRFFWIAGMFMLLRAAAYRQVNGFNQRLFLYCEDYDLCARLHLNGWKVAVDRAVSVVHDGQRDSRKRVSHLRWHVTSLFIVWTSSTFWKIWFGQGRNRVLM